MTSSPVGQKCCFDVRSNILISKDNPNRSSWGEGRISLRIGPLQIVARPQAGQTVSSAGHLYFKIGSSCNQKAISSRPTQLIFT